ncbi:glycogen debranching N-terminal domain-containing protein [Streptomyces avermitilis]|uniref:glycogen debranching N-terminal domain-containing protein n=1 Tax=Streptomyces avermitilis TaxID=33903 RepID=UPI00380C5C8E
MVEGPTFCVSGTSGDMEAEVPQGLFFRDMRSSPTGRSGWTATGRTTSPCFPRTRELLLERRRYVGEGMREDLRLPNLSTRPMSDVR